MPFDETKGIAAVEDLRQLFVRIQNLCENWPQKDPALWQRCQENNRHRQTIRTGRSIPIFSAAELGAYLDYKMADPEYEDGVRQAEKDVSELAGQIDHALYLNRDIFLNWPRVRETVLTADWRALRDKTIPNLVFAIRGYYDRGEFAKAIDDIDLYLKERRQNHSVNSKANTEKQSQDAPTCDRENAPGHEDETTGTKESPIVAKTVNIQNSYVFMADSSVTVNIDQHVEEHIDNLRDAIAAQPEDSPTFAKVAKNTAMDIIGSAMKDVAKGQIKEAAKQIYELGKDLGSVIVNTAAYAFFKSCLGQ